MTAREHRAIAWHPDSKELSWLKALLFSLALIPFGCLVQAAWAGDLGTQPAEFIQRRTGFWTFSFLLLTLSISPLRSLTQWHWLLRLRRMLGLFAFFYAALHALSFVGFQHAFAVDEIARDILKRPFIAIGFAAFVLLIPLAATSNQVTIRQLGGRRWQELHRNIYLIGILAAIHYLWQSKADALIWPIAGSAALVALLGWRIRERQRKAIPATAPTTTKPLHFFRQRPK